LAIVIGTLQAEKMEREGARESAFDEIYLKGGWGSAQGPVDGPEDTNSGGGSHHFNTVYARECLSQWLDKYNIQKLLDAPCGDANWQGLIQNIKGRYVGVDISKVALRKARSRERNIRMGMEFHHLDVVRHVVNGSRFDAVMFRDFLQHLSEQNAKKAIENVRAGNVTYLIVSTFPNSSETAQIEIAPSGRNDVSRPPFNLKNQLEDCCNHNNDCSNRLQLFKLSN